MTIHAVNHDVVPSPMAVPAEASVPLPGELLEIKPRLFWSRLPLPFEPFHVNVYIFEETDGWVIVDCGIDSPECRATWNALLAGALASRPILRIVVTHWHNDHLGLAGWLAQKTGARILMSQREHFRGSLQSRKIPELSDQRERSHLLLHGAPADAVSHWLGQGFRNISRISPLTGDFDILTESDTLQIGSRQLSVLSVVGHSLAGIALYCAAENFLICGDHLSPALVPNISVMSDAPDSNPHADYRATIPVLLKAIPDDALLLPGHEYPFSGLAATIDRIAGHHAKLANRILAAATDRPLSATDLIPAILRNEPSTNWLGFVIGRVLAYAHFLVSLDRLQIVQSTDGIRFQTVGSGELTADHFGRVSSWPSEGESRP